MLNKIWITLLIIGVTAALVKDVIESSADKYKNGNKINVKILPEKDIFSGNAIDAGVIIDKGEFNAVYKTPVKNDIFQKAKITFQKNQNRGAISLSTDDSTPEIWKEFARSSGKENDIVGEIIIQGKADSLYYKGVIIPENIVFANMQKVTLSVIEAAKTSVTIALGLIGIMALWLGIMKVAEESGLMKIISNAIKPLTRFLFPEIPHDHPAIGSMVMNISANMLGLGNAATPFGLKAMEELDKLNPEKGTATNSMCTFLAINTAGLTLIPATAIAIRAALGSTNPAIIIGTSIFGALCATFAGVAAAKFFEKFSIRNNDKKALAYFLLKAFGSILLLGMLAYLLIQSGIFKSNSSALTGIFKTTLQVVSVSAIPLIILSFMIYGFIKKVKVYETFVEGAKEGFNIAVKIIPYLVAMLCAIAIFRAGGGMDFLVSILTPVVNLIGMPAEAVPMAFLRPLSGSGSLGLMSEIITTHGPDSFTGVLVSTMFGSTETTFYVLALYFGSVNIKKARHALAAGLIADLAGMLGALFIVKLLFGLL